jgi:hypothetical protein
MCHSGEHAARGLRLDSYQGAIAGGDRGSVLVPRDATNSELIRRIRGESMPRMPFLSYPLGPEQTAVLVQWVEAGMPEGTVGDVPPRADPASRKAPPVGPTQAKVWPGQTSGGRE